MDLSELKALEQDVKGRRAGPNEAILRFIKLMKDHYEQVSSNPVHHGELPPCVGIGDYIESLRQPGELPPPVSPKLGVHDDSGNSRGLRDWVLELLGPIVDQLEDAIAERRDAGQVTIKRKDAELFLSQAKEIIYGLRAGLPSARSSTGGAVDNPRQGPDDAVRVSDYPAYVAPAAPVVNNPRSPSTVKKGLVEFELTLLRKIANKEPVMWGAAVGQALESLRELGCVNRGGNVTEFGRKVLEA